MQLEVCTMSEAVSVHILRKGIRRCRTSRKILCEIIASAGSGNISVPKAGLYIRQLSIRTALYVADSAASIVHVLKAYPRRRTAFCVSYQDGNKETNVLLEVAPEVFVGGQ